MPETLLATKLHLPPLPPHLLRRQPLLDLLESGLSPEKRLILVCAPAGYGKTTLVRQWLQGLASVSWFSLERSDNDPRLFFSYLVASLQKTFPGFGEQAQELLEAPQPPPIQAVLPSILNELCAAAPQGVLVLDDYHVIHANAIHEAVTFLLDHLPPGKHIVITTRSDPALPLHRYRSRGQMVEIRADDLRFSEAEVSSYMRDVAGISLRASEIATLGRRTEGWAAGLQMAALSMRGRADQEQVIRSLAGTNRYVMDYLLEEVLGNQPDTVQRFLMQTAILDQLCAPLCSALLKTGEDACQETLQNLERGGLFIIPLDDERCWYRYHHLFQDLLAMRLKQSSPEKVSALHADAASWYVSNGRISEAVGHYIQGSDFERAADLVEQHTLQLFAQGKLDQMVGWIRKLPGDLSARRPGLSVYQAWALAFAGKNQEAESLVGVAIRGLEENDAASETRRRARAEIHGLRALLSVTSGALPEALSLASVLDEDFPPESLFARSAILWALGYAWRMRGQLDKALTAFREMMSIGREINNIWTISTAFADLGMVLRLSGKLQEAEGMYRQGLDLMYQTGGRGLGFVGRLESFLANVLYEQDRLEEARQVVVDSIVHNQLWNNPNHLAHAYCTEARILLGQGDAIAAENALKRAEDFAAHPAVVPNLRALVETLRVRFWLAAGRLAEAKRWAEAHPLLEKTPKPNIEVSDLQVLTHVRILIAEGNLSAARKLLAELETSARVAGRNNTLIEALTLKALGTPGRAAALEVLESALTLGVPAGYRRTFLDEGDRLVQLLEGLRGRSALVEPLIGVAAAKTQMESPLTTREIDILRAMAEGLSNKEIGQRLFISTGTVKAHSAAIYRKLDVANRTGAIARAKDLGLL